MQSWRYFLSSLSPLSHINANLSSHCSTVAMLLFWRIAQEQNKKNQLHKPWKKHKIHRKAAHRLAVEWNYVMQNCMKDSTSISSVAERESRRLKTVKTRPAALQHGERERNEWIMHSKWRRESSQQRNIWLRLKSNQQKSIVSNERSMFTEILISRMSEKKCEEKHSRKKVFIIK